MDINLYKLDGSTAGTVSFDVALLDSKVRIRLLHQAVKMYEANKRQGNAFTKVRSEVCFTKRKPWRQKHTGRARSGSASSPVWVGGGVVFGPRPRDFSFSMPAKSRKTALKSALLSKFQDDEVCALTGFDLKEPRTAAIAKFLAKTGLNQNSVLFVTAELDPIAVKSVRNLDKANILPVSDLNAYEVLRHAKVVICKDALDRIAEEAAR